jgi:hypothetical protein
MTTAHVTGAHGRRLRRRPPRPDNPLLLPLAVLAGAAFLAFISIGYVLWPRWPEPPLRVDAPAVPITVAGVAFNVPPAAIRVPQQRRPGAHERVDLAFLWPSLTPPDASKTQQRLPEPGAPSATAQPPERIFVTITAAAETISPEQRVSTVYPRYTMPETTPGPSGLSILPFREGTPYHGEDLIYDAAAPGFLVRCTRNGPGPTPGTCLYERRSGAADLVLRFPRDWLGDWRAVAGGIDRLIASILRDRADRASS